MTRSASIFVQTGHERDHCVRTELYAHCPTDSLPCHASPGTDKECVLYIVRKGSAVATRLIVSFLEALQVRIKATIARKRLCVDWSTCHRVCHFSTSLPFILAEGLLRASDFRQVG